jgi:hypothetical protein
LGKGKGLIDRSDSPGSALSIQVPAQGSPTIPFEHTGEKGNRVTLYVTGFTPKDGSVLPGSRPNDQSGMLSLEENKIEI